MNITQPGKRRIWTWIGSILLLLIVIITIAEVYFSAKWKPLLTEKIKEGVYNGSNGLYHINFKNIQLNLLTGSATLDQVELMPDTAVFNQLKKSRQAPAHLFQLKLAKLQLSRIGILTAYFKRRVEMNAILLDRPSINMVYNKVPKKPAVVKDEKSLYDLISKTLLSIHVKSIKISDADFNYINGATSKTLHSVKHLDVNVKDLLIDSVSQFDTTRFYYTKDFTFKLTSYRSVTKDKMYTIKVDTVRGSATGKSIEITGLQMIPMYPDFTFSHMNKVQKDRYDFAFDKIKLDGVDFIRFNTEGSIHMKSLSIGPAKTAIFLNRDLPPAGVNKGGNFPHIALRRLPVETIIDTLKLRNIDLAYTEYNPISQKKGTIEFYKLSGNILNVTNDSLQLSYKNHAEANVSAYIQKAIKINVHLSLNLTAADAAFHFSGNIGAFDMKVLNPIAMPLGLLEVESGNVQKADFNMQANKTGSSGTVHFYYNNLKIKLFKEGEDDEPAKKKGLLSFLANGLLVKDANPDKDKPVRTAAVTFKRPPGASFFNLLWKSVFIGIRETVGLGIVPMKGPQKVQEEIKDKKQERKEKRQEKRKEKQEEN